LGSKYFYYCLIKDLIKDMKPKSQFFEIQRYDKEFHPFEAPGCDENYNFMDVPTVPKIYEEGRLGSIDTKNAHLKRNS
jgi:hypothetical protein